MSNLTEFVRANLSLHGEDASAERIEFYASVDELAKTVRSSKIWAMGEIFVYIPNPQDRQSKFLILKQVAPSSCEMAVFTQHGFHDVLTGYLYEHAEFVQLLEGWLNS